MSRLATLQRTIKPFFKLDHVVLIRVKLSEELLDFLWSTASGVGAKWWRAPQPRYHTFSKIGQHPALARPKYHTELLHVRAYIYTRAYAHVRRREEARYQ